LRKGGIVEQFKKEARKEYYHQDMDIINIVCKGKVKDLPPTFCVTIEIFNIAINNITQYVYSEIYLVEMLNKGIVHFNGPTPCESLCPNFDIWWEYYRKSIFFDSKFYFEFYYSKLNLLEQLSLWNRIKLVLRYFKTFSLRK